MIANVPMNWEGRNMRSYIYRNSYGIICACLILWHVKYQIKNNTKATEKQSTKCAEGAH
jgi:hypothetical protein